MGTTAHAIRRSLVIRERAKVEGKGKRDWLHNDYPASRGLSLAWLLACTKSLASLVTIILFEQKFLSCMAFSI